MFFYVALGAFAGVVVCGLLLIILGLKGGPWKLPGIGMAVCFVVLIASAVLLNLGGGDTDDPGTAGQPPGVVRESAEPGEESPGEREGPGEEDTVPVEESETPGNNEPYIITYQSSKIYKNSLGEIDCYVLVEIKNTGEDNLYLKDATFDFEDDSGSLLGTCSGIISSDPEIIAPGEKGYFYSNMGSVRGNIDEKTNYVFKPNLKVEKAKNDIIRYKISNLSIAEGRYGPVDVIGRVTNDTDKDDSLVWIACVLYRADGTPIGVYGTNVTDLKAGQTTSFDAGASFLSRLDIELSDVADYKVYACKTQYQF